LSIFFKACLAGATVVETATFYGVHGVAPSLSDLDAPIGGFGVEHDDALGAIGLAINRLQKFDPLCAGVAGGHQDDSFVGPIGKLRPDKHHVAAGLDTIIYIHYFY
jgi:hypothetical protein